MTASVEKLPGMPIILMTFDAHADQQVVAEAYSRSLEIFGESDQMLYRVVDLQAAGASYAAIITTLRELAKGLSYASVFPDMLYIVIGKHNMAGFCAQVKLPFFATFTEAQAYAKDQIGDSLLVA